MNISRPKLLDLFCCAGGASKGYDLAGFDVFGVDLSPQPHYPYPFIQADALNMLDILLDGGTTNDARIDYKVGWGYRLESFAGFAASPPCQAYSKLSLSQPGTQESYPNLIPRTRELLRATGKPYAIENVPQAPLMPNVKLCGCMFGKRLQLPRIFETNFPVRLGPECDHTKYVLNPHNSAGRDRMRAEFGENANLAKIWRDEKGVPWMNWDESSEAIIPDYTEYIGNYMMHSIELAQKTRMAA